MPNTVAFVAHCMLNQNSKTDGGALCPGVYSPLVEVLREQGARIEQMPCPELGFLGLNRFWAVKEQLDTIAYRRHCRRLAGVVAGMIDAHLDAGSDVVIIGLEGSPTMGVRITCSNERWGGRPDAGDSYELVPGRGIFLEEIEAELASRGRQTPRAMGISHQFPDHDPAVERAQLEALIGGDADARR